LARKTTANMKSRMGKHSVFMLAAAWFACPALGQQVSSPATVSQRITPEELRDKLSAGGRILVLDLQGGLSQGQGLPAIPGAVRIDSRKLSQYMKQYRGVDLATDREVILYCASPGETTSARVALALRQRGFEHVRPLAGGLQSWCEHGFPVTTEVRVLAAPEHAVFVLREVLQYSRMNAARLLETSVANVDQLLEGARKRLGRTASAQQAITPE